jgi:NADH-quinone oxidoreductase subunit M
MILAYLIAVPILGGLAAWALAWWSPRGPRWVALLAATVELALALALWVRTAGGLSPASTPWLVELSWPWVPQLGVRFHLALDGLSLLMVLLTAFLGLVAVAASWTAIRARVGFYYLNLMLVLAGITGVFLAMDLFLFYFCWELMLVPMYFLIDVWGHENRHYAAIKFFIFTQLSGLLMLIAILGLYFIHGRNSGEYTFDYTRLLGTAMAPATAMWLMLGFAAAFLVKLPAVPFHTWLPDAHTEAPTAGSVILAGLLLKTGAYGLLRFAVPLFPGAAAQCAPVAMLLGVIGILYGAVLAFAQTDLKRLVAYTSVSHLGFVLLGIFAGNPLARQGTVLQMICHGLSTGALFMLVGALDDRLHTRDMRVLGGLWTVVPRLGAVALFFALASLGLPGLGNFVAEFLVLLGAFQVNVALAAVASVGFVAATIYALWMMQQTFHGPPRAEWKLADLTGREMAVLLAMIAALVGLGLYPQPVLNAAAPALERLQRASEAQVVTAYGREGASESQAIAPTFFRSSAPIPSGTPTLPYAQAPLPRSAGDTP